ncbi:hypothetical protein EV126DRAFT_224684 [Verticillium dahliae]|nr:hypothetical protein EV126DRAFT_224684 [Verticillium dahliae]
MQASSGLCATAMVLAVACRRICLSSWACLQSAVEMRHGIVLIEAGLLTLTVVDHGDERLRWRLSGLCRHQMDHPRSPGQVEG